MIYIFELKFRVKDNCYSNFIEILIRNHSIYFRYLTVDSASFIPFNIT